MSVVSNAPRARITLADVATLAGVTAMTVSRYLREPERVSAATGETIRLAIERLGYMPNKHAGMLAGGSSRIVAAIVPNLSNSIFADSIQGLSEVLQEAGLELLLASSGYAQEREQELLQTVLGWHPCAVVVTGSQHTTTAIKLLTQVRDNGTPVIEIWDQRATRERFIQVGFSHTQVGALMASHLIARGYRDLAYVDSGVSEDVRAHLRAQGFLKAAAKAGVPARLVVAEQTESMAAGRQALHQLLPLQGLARPQAIAFANDHLAAGAWLQAQAQGLAVPQQLGLLGFGNFAISGQLGGGISTVDIPKHAIGQVTGRKLLAEMGLGAAPKTPINTHFKPEVVQRATS